jgi:L-lysine 6-transaminase
MVRFSYIVDAISKENLVSNANKVGSHLLWNLRQIRGIDNTRGKGLMIAFDVDNLKKRDEIVSKLQNKMLVLKCGIKSIRLRPSLTFSKEDADLASSYIEEAVK